jgi:glycosyltransferase involved in cell wall biosynthesis
MNVATSNSPARIRIVRIIDRLNVGGPAKHVTWLTAGLNPAEFQTTLITGTVPPSEGDMTDYARAAGITPLIIPEMSRELGLRDIIVIGKIWRELVRLKPDIIHTHKAKAGAAGRLAAWLYRWLTPSTLWLRPRSCSVVHTFHGHIFHSYYGAAKTKLFIFIERALAWLCTDRIITISVQQRREINEEFGVGQRNQFRVIPLGIDCDESLRIQKISALRTAYKMRDDELSVGIVGRLCEVKNHAMFLDAIARLRKDDPALVARTRFFLIGDGHLRNELEQQAKRLGIIDRVTFTGFRADVVALYEELDLVALTSLNEGTPLTLIEAMNSGCAVVATEVGGVIDILGQRGEQRVEFSCWEHGITTSVRDVAAFANALQLLLTQPDLRRLMGERGRDFVRTNLSRERLLQDIATLYQELNS